MDSSEKSSSSGTSESWLFISKNNVGEEDASAGKNPENNLKSSDEMEDSDGISVISESEMCKHQTSDGELEKTLIPDDIEEGHYEVQDDAKNKQIDQNQILLTPPQTPNEFNKEEQELQLKIIKRYDEQALKEFNSSETVQTLQKSNHVALLLIVVSLIIAILYTNVSSLKNELARTVSHYEQRILRLEEENQLLRSQLDELMNTLKSPHDNDSFKEKVLPPLKIKKEQDHQGQKKDEPVIQKPITKNVWMGGEQNEAVKVLDPKYNSLPDYCYFTDKNDLFYDYNMENCEKKKQKLEERKKKFHSNEKKDIKYQRETEFVADQDTGSDKLNADDIWKSNDKIYNDFMSKSADEILKSLNDEIQEIKNNRNPQTIKHANNDDKLKYETTEKQKTKPKNYEGSGDKKWKDNKKREHNFENNQSQKRPKQEEKKRQNKDNKNGDSGDWVDQRSKAREDARMKKENDENWYLKRKNERELHRLENFRN